MRKRVPPGTPRSKQAASKSCCIPTCLAIAENGPFCAVHRHPAGPPPRRRRRTTTATPLPLIEAIDRHELDERLVRTITEYAARKTWNLLTSIDQEKTNG